MLVPARATTGRDSNAAASQELERHGDSARRILQSLRWRLRR
jgi:hypothetical protein